MGDEQTKEVLWGPSAEQRDEFLAYIREGCDRPTAAFKVSSVYTGTQFKRLCSPQSPHYDAEFAAAYEQACEDRGPLNPARYKEQAQPRTHTALGHIRHTNLTVDDQEAYLERVRSGIPTGQAALAIGTSWTQIQRLCSHNAEFNERFHEACREGRGAMQESLRSEAYRQAMNGDYKALRDLMMIHLPEYEVLRTQRHEIGGLGGGALKLALEQHLQSLPAALLDEVIQSLEAAVAEETNGNGQRLLEA